MELLLFVQKPKSWMGLLLCLQKKLIYLSLKSLKKSQLLPPLLKLKVKRKEKESLQNHNTSKPNKVRKNTIPKVELTPEQIQKQVRENLAKLQSGGKNKGAKLRREKRQARKEQEEIDLIKIEEESKTIQVTEFVTTAEFAQLMNVQPTEVISACFSLGMMVTQNQRLDAETLSIVSEEFGYTIEFVGAEVQESISSR